MAQQPSAAAAAGAAAAALLQKQLEADEEAGEIVLPTEGWTEHQSGDGRKFYHHKDTGLSTWEKPDELMSEEERLNDTPWREYRIWDGRAFYYNKETKVSCWSMPPELRKQRGESTGMDDRPLPQTQSEKRKLFLELMKDKGIDDNWSWGAAVEALRDEPLATGLTESAQKQCFAELVGSLMRQKQIDSRDKERSIATAFELLIEKHFGRPQAVCTTYEEAKARLEGEEAWNAIKSDLRRDEVFQNVMERLEEKHKKARIESRSDKIARLQRRMGSDPELRRRRVRWVDAALLLAHKDELFDNGELPLDALRVWSALKDLKASGEFEREGRAKPTEEEASKVFREERKRREAFQAWLKDLALRGVISSQKSWFDFEPLAVNDPRFICLQDGPGATAMELYGEFIEDLSDRGAEAVLGAIPGSAEAYALLGEEPPAKRARTGVKEEDDDDN